MMSKLNVPSAANKPVGTGILKTKHDFAKQRAAQSDAIEVNKPGHAFRKKKIVKKMVKKKW